MTKERTSTWVRLVTTAAGRMAFAASERGLILMTLPGRPEDCRPAHEGVGAGEKTRGRDGRNGPRLDRTGTADAAQPPAKVATILDRTEKALVAYYAAWPQSPGSRLASWWEELAGLPIDFGGLTSFSRKVMECLREVPPGTVTTYGELAARAGSPRAARAVGMVMARNPVPVVIPCHRVVASDGTLGGFSGGTREEALAFKESLLRYEGWCGPTGRKGRKGTKHG